MTEIPEKYRGSKRNYEKKDWLYERYWGEMLSLTEVAAECEVGSYEEVRVSMREFGIPRRGPECHEDSVSPFRGFYDADTPAFCESAENGYDPEYADDTPYDGEGFSTTRSEGVSWVKASD